MRRATGQSLPHMSRSGPKLSTATSTAGRRSDAVQAGVGSIVLSPEIFAHTFGSSAAGGERRPTRPSLGAERRLAEVVDDDRQAGEALRELGQVAEMSREDAGKLEHEATFLHAARLSSTPARKIQWGSGSS